MELRYELSPIHRIRQFNTQRLFSFFVGKRFYSSQITQVRRSRWQQTPILEVSKLHTIKAVSKCWKTVTTSHSSRQKHSIWRLCQGIKPYFHMERSAIKCIRIRKFSLVFTKCESYFMRELQIRLYMHIL